MLSYQHAYHAGNLADVHKHALLSAALAYLTRKDKPLTYLETHAGRGLYDLAGAEAARTREAETGIARMLGRLPADHPYATAVTTMRAQHGPDAYPGSPLIAAQLLRDTDKLRLAELHPAENAALQDALRYRRNATVYREDGFAMAASLCPPTPRRGMLLIDPSWEVKTDYARIPRRIGQILRAWNVGIAMLWYPLLADAPHAPMLAALEAAHPDALRHEVRFAPARDGHRMIGSGLFVINPPFGLDREAQRIGALFADLA